MEAAMVGVASSGDRRAGGPKLSRELVQHYRDVLVAHADGLVTGACPHCRVSRCRIWIDAYDRLAAAGEAMATPDRWDERRSMFPWFGRQCVLDSRPRAGPSGA
jgi:hypothetical protein